MDSSLMDNSGKITNRQNAALVIFAFLQGDCRDQRYNKELISLCNDFTADWDDGELEADGHLPEKIQGTLDDIQPQVELQWLVAGHAGDVLDYHAVAEGLRDIAAQFELGVLTRATQNLSRNISRSPSEHWKDHLADEVDRLMKRGVALEHLHQEQVIVALTLTLVKGICLQAPQLLRSLFTTVHQFVCYAGSR